MLSEIRVSNFAIIDSLSIPFFSGLNIISGETGAGKSILIKSLGLLMGAKSSQTDIRHGQDQAVIEGAFDIALRNDIREKLETLGIPSEDNQLIVRRILHKSGKSRVYLNGSLSTVGDLRLVVYPLVTLSNPSDAPLIEITGQHENKNLTSSHYQMDLLDQYSGTTALREDCHQLFTRKQAIVQEIEDIETKAMEREQRMDFLKFQIEEIEELNLSDGEDANLLEKIRFMRQQGKWQEWFYFTDTSLSGSNGSVLGLLKKIQTTTPDANRSELKNFLNQIDQAYNLIEDASFLLNQSQQSMTGDESSDLDSLENRLNRIRKLQKKFGEDVPQIIAQHESMKTELKTLEESDLQKSQLEKELKKIQLQLKELCHQLSTKRQKGAQSLSKKVNAELKDLNMKGLSFNIGIQQLKEPQSNGQDEIDFLVQNSKADQPRPLAKTASGGELSRILLSLKQILGKSKNPRTFLFDEVDTGVSGQTAERVGAKLQLLAKGQQVLCVTHLPQVACYGNHHFYIEKQPDKKGVHMSVQQLGNKDRVQEIARLLSGEKVSKTSLAHAKQLLSESLGSQ